MEQTTNYAGIVKTQTKVYDHLFIAIFGKDSERSKRWRLELYNALNNTNYTDPDALELNTLENVIYIKMHNDVSFLIDSQMTLYEHQRTTNPNMPLRGFFYFAQLYQKYIDSKRELIGTSTLIKIPNPNYIVFYNGDKGRDADYELKLSDAFFHEDKSGKFEWTARVLNVNKEYNLSLQKKCKPLYDYIQFVSRINENKENGMTIEEAVDEAVDWACEQNLLEGYIREQKAEVKMNLLTEYDEEAYIRIWRRDGIIQGKQEQAIETAKKMLSDELSPDKVSHYSGLPLEEVLELQKQISVNA